MADRPPDQVSCTFLYFGLTFSTLHHIIKEVYLNSFTFFQISNTIFFKWYIWKFEFNLVIEHWASMLWFNIKKLINYLWILKSKLILQKIKKEFEYWPSLKNIPNLKIGINIQKDFMAWLRYICMMYVYMGCWGLGIPLSVLLMSCIWTSSSKYNF